ncbi:cation:proton antiporter [Vulgatibacter sp.]|uniref:cation:proton antiporter domain-containing protein n=1 Tax=Vulgatibacter sp. TaxID=1971226 RepID=UPI003563CF1F
MANPTVILAVLSLLVFVGLGLEQFFRRTGVPDVLVLLGLGIAAGATGLVDVSQIGGLAKVFTTSALVLILFEGAIQLRLADLRSAFSGTLRITLVGFLAAMVALTVVGVVFMGMRPLAGMLLGAILGGTSSAVVIPIVQAMKLERDTRTVLTLESAFTDVLCIVFALALVGALSAGEVNAGEIGTQLGLGFGGALLLGGGMGLLWACGLKAMRQRRVSFVAIGAAVFLVYALAEALGTFGAIACLAFGVVLGNAPAVAKGSSAAAGLELAPGERLFLAEVAFLLKVFFFVYLGASLQLGAWQPWIYGALVTAAIFASRPLVVRLGLPRAVTPRRDARVASVLAPRGLAAAVLASVPVQAGIAEGQAIEAAAVGAILFSITLASGLVFAIDHPFVQRLYERFFRGYPEAVEVAAEAAGGAVVAMVPAAAPQPHEMAEVAAVALPHEVATEAPSPSAGAVAALEGPAARDPLAEPDPSLPLFPDGRKEAG